MEAERGGGYCMWCVGGVEQRGIEAERKADVRHKNMCPGWRANEGST